MSLQLSDKFSLPKSAVLWTFAFLAIRGAGKTYDAAKLAEQILKQGYPIVVFDPMGIWWGLRVGVNGHEGFPIMIVGGQHQDLAIPLQSGKKGFTIVDENKLREMVNGILEAGLSVIVDTSSLSSRTQQTRTVAFFADELFKRNARFGIRHVFIEEADVYVPQKPLGETEASHTAIDNLVRRGGNFNLGCTMISQRSAVIDKDVLSQANCLVALRILYVRDKEAIREWVKNAVKNEAEMKKLAKWYDSLKKLKNGEAWVYSPEHNDLFEKVQFGERETLHASREYFLQETWEQKNITLRDITQFVKAYKARIEPKPTVQPTKPMVTTVIGPFPHDYSASEHKIGPVQNPKNPSVQTNETIIGQSSVGTVQTIGRGREEIQAQSEFQEETERTTIQQIYAKSSAGVSSSKNSSEQSANETNRQPYSVKSEDKSALRTGGPTSRSDFEQREEERETRGQSSSETPTLGPLDLHVPIGQKEDSQVRVQDRRTLQSPSDAQFGPALGETLSDTVVQQSLPTIEIHQTRPILRLPVESLNEPTTALGRLVVVIINRQGSNSSRWTRKSLKEAIVFHAWPVDGIDEAIDQLIRWEILRGPDKANYLWSRRERIKTVEVSPILGLQ